MRGKLLVSAIASIVGIFVSFFMPAPARYAPVYAPASAPPYAWRAPRATAVYGYYRARHDDDDWDDEYEHEGRYYGGAYQGYYGYAPDYGNVTVVVGDGGYGHGYGYGPGRPPGWAHGRKRGWGGCDLPPGLAKKYGCYGGAPGGFVVGFSAGR